MRKLIFLNRYFHPDISATSQMASSLAFELAKAGYHVHALTSGRRYDNSGAVLPAEETVDGVSIHRVRTSGLGGARLIGKLVDYLSFYIGSLRRLRALVDKDDVVIVMTDPPLLSVFAQRVISAKSAHLINWLQDIFPETAMKLGALGPAAPFAGWMRRLRDNSLRKAAVNVVIGESMAEYLASRGIPRDKIAVIENWADEGIHPIDRDANPLRKEWSLADKFVVGYCGNLGRAHEYETILQAAIRLKDDPNIVFLFVGGGARLPALKEAVARHGLTNFIFKPYQDHSRLAETMSVPDLHLISLRPELEGLVIPSKFYAILAAGRPMVFIGDSQGELAHQILGEKCGWCVSSSGDQALATQLRILQGDLRGVEAAATQARKISESHKALARLTECCARFFA